MNLFHRIQRYLTGALDRLWDNSWAVTQTAAAAGFAYLLASFFQGGAQQAFYAPIVAIVCLSLTLGQPGRHAILITLGVTVGLTVAYRYRARHWRRLGTDRGRGRPGDGDSGAV